MIKMNLPNKLTCIRIILIPFFVMFYSLAHTISKYSLLFYVIAVIIFVFASLTDFLDGYIARKYNLITNFGKLLDPLADKTLTTTAFLCFTVYNYIPLWTVLIVIFREFLISGFRLIALEQNIVIAASKWGKYKTALQMICIILILCQFHCINSITYFITYLLFYTSIALTVVSLIDYIYKNKQVICTDI